MFARTTHSDPAVMTLCTFSWVTESKLITSPTMRTPTLRHLSSLALRAIQLFQLPSNQLYVVPWRFKLRMSQTEHFLFSQSLSYPPLPVQSPKPQFSIWPGSPGLLHIPASTTIITDSRGFSSLYCHPNPPALLLTLCYCPIYTWVTSHLIAEKPYWSCFQTSLLQSIFPAVATSRYKSDPVTLLIQSLSRFPRGCEIMSKHLQSAHRASRKGAPHASQFHRTTCTSPSSFTALHSWANFSC